MKNKDKIIGSIGILAVFIIFFIFGALNNNEKNYKEEDIFVESSNNGAVSGNKPVENTQNKIIKVQIKGAIKEPGVYTLNSGERVEDLIKKAGGVTSEADVDKIASQAKKLRDEECIIIPKKGEEGSVTIEANKNVISTNISPDNEKVNINTAAKEELMKVPGIGEVIADNIIKYRENNGDFMTLEDLKKVDRIGDKTFEKMKEKLEVN